MNKLHEVDEAKALMTEAMSWSVMKWLTEKKRVRRTADKANHALWAMQEAAKQRWGGDLRLAYTELAAPDGHSRHKTKAEASATLAEIKRLAHRIKEADDEAYRAHLDAEETFDKADRLLSTRLAREGCQKAIRSWELYEKAILRAEAVTTTQ
jgi:hypothetical protein